jgi:hypothetical protein
LVNPSGLRLEIIFDGKQYPASPGPQSACPSRGSTANCERTAKSRRSRSDRDKENFGPYYRLDFNSNSIVTSKQSELKELAIELGCLRQWERLEQ